MPEPNQLVYVNYVTYEAYETAPTNVINLGAITTDQAQELLDTFNTSDVAPNACIKTLSMEYKDSARFGMTPGFGPRYSSLDIDGLFYCDTYPQCKQTIRKTNEISKLKHCARNLRAGKCTDEFIKNTLGAALYPQHYGKQK